MLSTIMSLSFLKTLAFPRCLLSSYKPGLSFLSSQDQTTSSMSRAYTLKMYVRYTVQFTALNTTQKFKAFIEGQHL